MDTFRPTETMVTIGNKTTPSEDDMKPSFADENNRIVFFKYDLGATAFTR